MFIGKCRSKLIRTNVRKLGFNYPVDASNGFLFNGAQAEIMSTFALWWSLVPKVKEMQSEQIQQNSRRSRDKVSAAVF